MRENKDTYKGGAGGADEGDAELQPLNESSSDDHDHQKPAAPPL
eukprot:CAMPEP_0173400734 /NCGR_PEP_ID=MMETSP1356-20130122/48760_1 /TAXON_ID=77927 ORGANISM="Hemiselmis virescens, Strain PCC157" /NCGR_SAMPLE_ID=MMETSP1356 /ASSEMBLY_ACC=CAM_ASM_000847 /LENGTH=43 /DNA_ID= /DNA_START= /DNA_END= /DNA_ORIENTATION=